MELVIVSLFAFAVLASLFSPIIGLFTFFVITYVRPQDYNLLLANIEPAKVILYVTLLSFLFHKATKKGPITWSSQNWAILVVFLFVLFSRFRAVDSLRWWLGAGDFLRVLIVYFIFINLIDTEKKLKWFFLVFLAVNLIVAMRFYLAYRNGTAVYWGSKPGDFSYGFLANADDLGLGLVVVLPFALMPVYYARNIFVKGLSALASGLFMLGALATHSRGALLGVFVVFIVSITTHMRVGKLRNSKFAAGILIALALFLFFNYKYHYAINEQYLSAQDEKDPGRLGRDSSWGAARLMIKANPLTGVGRGNFVPNWMMNYEPGIFGYQAVHNIILEIASEIGLIGLFFFFYFSLYGLIEILKLRKRYKEIMERKHFLDMIFAIYAVSLIGFYVNGMFITVAFYWHVYVLVAIFVSAKSIFMREMIYAGDAAGK